MNGQQVRKYWPEVVAVLVVVVGPALMLVLFPSLFAQWAADLVAFVRRVMIP